MKGCQGFFSFCLDLDLFAKIKKYLVSTHPRKPGLSIAQYLNKIKKHPESPFVDIGKQETRAKSQKKILNSMVVGAYQSFQFFRKITWLLGNNRGLSKFRVDFSLRN